ncbi:MAG: hypothetical protein Q8929_17330, partial [Bacillota bacterium]|nr:hypothetical protein [Bacillota bacterium]
MSESPVKENKHSWAQKGKDVAYEEDIAALYKFFSGKIYIKLLEGNKEESEHHKYTLVSDNGFWYISERDPELRKIVKGSLVNTYLIREMTKHLSSYKMTIATAILGLVISNNLYSFIVGLLPQGLAEIIKRKYP